MLCFEFGEFNETAASTTIKHVLLFSYSTNFSKLKGVYNLCYKLQQSELKLQFCLWLAQTSVSITQSQSAGQIDLKAA